MKPVLLVLVLLCPQLVLAGNTQTLEELERQEKADAQMYKTTKSFQKLEQSAQELSTLVEEMSRKKETNCLKAFGNSKFCACLREKTPVGISFMGYIQVTTSTKEELKYNSLSKQDKEMVDNTLKAREQCVKEVWK